MASQERDANPTTTIFSPTFDPDCDPLESQRESQAIALVPKIPVYDSINPVQVPTTPTVNPQVAFEPSELPFTPVSSKRKLSQSPVQGGQFISPGGTPSAKNLTTKKKQKKEVNVRQVRKSPEKFH